MSAGLLIWSLSLLVAAPLFSSSAAVPSSSSLSWDPSGYVLYVPSNNRFGNQIELVLGALQFAKHLDRTLVLPWLFESSEDVDKAIERLPWPLQPTARVFSKHLNVAALSRFHRVVAIDSFLTHPDIAASTHWPLETRRLICANEHVCPSDPLRKPYFDEFDAAVGLSFPAPLWMKPFDLNRHRFPLLNAQVSANWRVDFPSSKFPVLAFSEPPASIFGGPVTRLAATEPLVAVLQNFRWNQAFDRTVRGIFRQQRMLKPVLAVHVRNMTEWHVNACRLMGEERRSPLMASAQCVPYGELLTMEHCRQSESQFISHVTTAVEKLQSRTLYIAADVAVSPLAIETLSKILVSGRPLKVVAGLTLDGGAYAGLPEIDLAVLERADFSILNCVSSYSSFVRRLRDGRSPPWPSGFFGVAMPESEQPKANTRIEL